MQGHLTLPSPTLISLPFIPLDLRVLTAIWQCGAVAIDALGSKRPLFYSPYQAGIDFLLITEGHKKREGIFERQMSQKK